MGVAFASLLVSGAAAYAQAPSATTRTGYQPVYRPREVQFGAIATVNGDIVQRVELIGPDGKPALALYVMQRQADASWKINGCFLTASEQRTT